MGVFSELNRIEKLAETASALNSDGKAVLVSAETLGNIEAAGRSFPIHAFMIGSRHRAAPALGLFGGVHGLERVGTHVVISYLEGLFAQLEWDEHLRELFSKVRIVAIPLINPGGMFLGRRSNPRGVDLNRNSPVEAQTPPPWLAGGHRIGPWLPWYRGPAGAEMEPEARALADFVKKELFPSKMALSIDFHSGFGLQDRLWYPYARTTEPFPRINEALSLKRLFDRSYPHHIYTVEPQSLNYTQHGDLWDYLFDEHRAHAQNGGVFLPWTLEMGSWQWVKKNPKQLFSLAGPFNPVKPHRYRRIMRRHVPLIDFFLRAALNHPAWVRA